MQHAFISLVLVFGLMPSTQSAALPPISPEPHRITEAGPTIAYVDQLAIKQMDPIKPLDIQPMPELEPVYVPPPEPVIHTPSTPVQKSGYYPGNMYEPGNCTWYAKSRRADIPNDLGNANAWYGSAGRYGMARGNAPAVGAVGVSFGGQYGHVVIVEAVHGNTVTISEMNYQGLGVVSSRTTSASEFVYIY